MAALSPSQIADLAYRAGFRGTALTMAVAVALAESSGNPSAYNPETAAGTPSGKGSYGLWQIYRNAHPEFASVNLFDPSLNAMAAYSVYRAAGNSFTPWSTFNNGSAYEYAKQLKGVSYSPNGGSGGGGVPSNPFEGVTGVGVGGSGPSPSGSGSENGGGGLFPNISINLLPQNVMDFLGDPSTGMRLVAGLVGFLLVGFGLLMFVGMVGQGYSRAQISATRQVLGQGDLSQIGGAE